MGESSNYYKEDVLAVKLAESSENELLNEKKEEIYKFFSNEKIFMIVLIIWFGFFYSLYALISSFSSEGYGIFIGVIYFLLCVAFNLVIPIGFYKLYSGSKKKNEALAISGIKWLISYCKIFKVVLAVTIVIAFIYLLQISLLSIPIIIPLIVLALIFSLAFYVLSIAKRFLMDLSSTFYKPSELIPSPSKIMVFMAIALVLSVIGFLAYIWAFSLIENLISSQNSEDMQLLLGIVIETKIYVYIAVSISIVCQTYYLYVTSLFEKKFCLFNADYKLKVIAAKLKALGR
jgi:hypothetical protein